MNRFRDRQARGGLAFTLSNVGPHDVTTKYSALVLLGLGALYLAIWPHELGHSLAAFLFGCKANWWQTDMSWYLWSSWGGNIDYECLASRGPLAVGVTAFAGIAANLALLALAPIGGRWGRVTAHPGARPRWWFIATFCLALANYTEAISYLIVNTAWLSSDMRTVVVASGLSRWVWLSLGGALGIVVTRLLKPAARRAASALSASPAATRLWLIVFVLYVLAAGGGMTAARLMLT